MSVCTRIWACTKGFEKGARVEEHVFMDGTQHYNFIDRRQCVHTCSYTEAQRVIKNRSMECVFVATDYEEE